MNHESSSTSAASPSARRPQQHNLSNQGRQNHQHHQHGSVVRHTPPSAYPPPSSARTPRSHVRYSGNHTQQYSSPSNPYYGSPFSSTPPPASARKPRGSPQHTTPRHNLLDRQDFDSPFMSPSAINSISSPQKSRHRPEPLVLDPSTPSFSTPPSSAATATNATSKHRTQSISRRNSSGSSHRNDNNNNSSVPVVSKLFQAATKGMSSSSSPARPHGNLHTTPAATQESSAEPASIMARTSSQAGFLHKLGRNIPEFKRRFFVLKPETRLYYYLSPNDTEPRGKIDLEGSRIEPLEELPDGRFRFAVISEDFHYGESRIVLESRSKEVGLEWMKGLKNERVSALKENVDQLHGEKRALKNVIQDLEKQIDNFRMMEKDRDGALEDARNWKEKFLALDEAIRGLTQFVRKPPVIPKMKRKTSDDELSSNDDDDEEEEHVLEEEKKVEHAEETTDPPADANDVTVITRNHNDMKESSEELDFSDMEKLKDVPGTYFSSLSNACQQQRELFRLASIEAATAVEDVLESNERVEAIGKRMEKAEKHLTKLWEENCSIRKNLRQRKQEKKLLVKEVKSLQQANKELEDRALRTPIANRYSPSYDANAHSNGIGNEGERLLNELEDHVSSSIRLHERLVAGSVLDNVDAMALDNSVEVTEIAFSSSPDKLSIAATATEDSEAPSKQEKEVNPNTPGASSRLQSLFDDDESELESESEIAGGDGDGLNEYESVAPTVSSAGATMGEITELILPEMESPGRAMSPLRQNPVLKLDADDEDDVSHMGSTNSDGPRSKVTHNGQATSRLVCPLADVVESKTAAKSETGEFNVYHISFYSKKIGIQFQKAPPAPKKSRGLLTDAMTADLDDKTSGSGKTAAELTTIASIHSSVASGSNKEGDVCVIADPKDIVLVCGFEGFDDSNANQRPKLGARLVAFDGISVEVGPWTFDSIRKGIQARGRPLTLSFRNDFLTTEQRAVLTKAVGDMDVKRPPPVETIPRSSHHSLPKTNQIHRRIHRRGSVNSARSDEYDHFVNESPKEMLNISDAVNPKNCCHGSASSSLASRIKRTGSMNSGTDSAHSNLRSFSETGSSTISAAVAPLVAKLMKGVKAKREKENYTPVYLQQSPKSLESTPQHQDFHSNLL
ncbi:unnamed protein product [Cylindrotheca closterium]|uniref:PH domain-containing protein n=1 Tax=Cylindrotheca closterium TaxID=2856 RepID=A0AAD2CAF6_9STRA|nr:unnamed protein product [Cylindrotheca closterium]